MHYYIAQWVEQTDDQGPVFRPPMDERGDWNVIDLRPDSSVVDGYCLISSDHVHPATPGLWYLTDDLDATLSPPIKNYIENGLGITLAAPTLRGAIAEIMLIHARLDGSRWKPVRKNPQTNLVEIYLRGLVYEAPEIVGAVYTESFNTSDSDTLGPDLSWTEVQGDWDIVSNRARLGAAGSPVSYARADSNTDGDDQYAQCDVHSLIDDGSNYTQFGICARFYNAGNSSYMMFIQADANVDEGYKLRKTTTGTRTDVTSYTTTTLPTEPYEVKITAVGSTLKGFINDTEYPSNTDTSFSGANYRRAGLYGYGGAGSSSPWIEVDAFEYGDYSAATGTGIGGWGMLPAS